MQYFQRPLNLLFYHNELSPGALFHIPRFHKHCSRLQRLFAAISPCFIEERLEARLRRVIEEHVGDHYADSNRRTQELIGMSLGEFGYSVR